MVEHGHTPRDVQRTLNAEGIRTARGGPWNTRKVRHGVLDSWYAGKATAYGQEIDDHEPLIEPARWRSIAALLERDDPVGKIARAGGRPADSADGYLLRGIASCGRCGASLYTRRLAAGRQYICRAVREGHGSCDAAYIPAGRVEQAVLNHLDSFVGDLEGWLADKVSQADAARQGFADALDGQRRELAASSRRIERAQHTYERAVDSGSDARADVALDELARLKREHSDHGERLDEAELRLAGWPSPPEIDQALDLYNRLRDAVQGRVRAAESIQELNATLRSVLGAAVLDSVDDILYGWFRLRLTDDVATGRLPHTRGVVERPHGGGSYNKWSCEPPLDEDEIERRRNRPAYERYQEHLASMPAYLRLLPGRRWPLQLSEELNTTCS